MMNLINIFLSIPSLAHGFYLLFLLWHIRFFMGYMKKYEKRLELKTLKLKNKNFFLIELKKISF